MEENHAPVDIRKCTCTGRCWGRHISQGYMNLALAEWGVNSCQKPAFYKKKGSHPPCRVSQNRALAHKFSASIWRIGGFNFQFFCKYEKSFAGAGLQKKFPAYFADSGPKQILL